PALMHEVQTFILRVVPPPAGVRTVWMFGFQRRLVRRGGGGTFWPEPRVFFQVSPKAGPAISWGGTPPPGRAGHAWARRRIRATGPGSPILRRRSQSGATEPAQTARRSR